MMDADDKMREMASYRNKSLALSDENYRNQSRRRLQKVIETKINTTMIGAISAMENKFGQLWGQGKPAHQLTDEEIKWLTLKEELRTEILNNGNSQKRAAVAEINQYEITWKRHHMDLHVQERKRDESNDPNLPRVEIRGRIHEQDGNK